MAIERIAKKALLRLAGQFPIIGIVGPRQTGKSTLAKTAFSEKRYISFDDKAMREMASANPKDFLQAFPDGAVFDEAQKVPEIFDAVKFAVDNGSFTPGKFVLTGSNQFKLKENMSDSLAGRAGFVKLLPFSNEELASANALSSNPYETIFKSCYPPLYDKEKKFLLDDWFDNYIDTYLGLDVRYQINVSNLPTFKKFIRICALHSGQLLSMESIAKNLGVSAPTVKQWLSVLESSFLIHFLQPDTNNLGRSLVKTPKLYFTDTGLLCHLLGIDSPEELILSQYRGVVVETFAVAELTKKRTNQGKSPNLAFFRDAGGLEMDIVADWKHSFSVEVKSTSEAERKLSAGVRKYLALRGDENFKSKIFYLGDLTCNINGIRYVGWKDWGKEES